MERFKKMKTLIFCRKFSIEIALDYHFDVG